MGSHILLTGTILDQPARIVVPPTATVEAGTRIGLSVDPRRLTWIDPETGKAIRG
jgi:multiple sugar transport system ATP-binding protein